MTERQKIYRKENTKRVVINLTLSDYERWRAAADLRSEPMASFIRSQVESYIKDTESDHEKSITDIEKYQEELKDGVLIV